MSEDLLLRWCKYQVLWLLILPMVFVKKCKVQTTVLVSLLFLGLVYNFLLLPYMAPDERTHIDMTYRYSNDLLGIPYTGNEVTLAKRVDDTKIELVENPALSNYYIVFNELLQGVQDDSLVITNTTANTYAPIFVYLPAVLGMTLARLLGFGSIAMQARASIITNNTDKNFFIFHTPFSKFIWFQTATIIHGIYYKSRVTIIFRLFLQIMLIFVRWRPYGL